MGRGRIQRLAHRGQALQRGRDGLCRPADRARVGVVRPEAIPASSARPSAASGRRRSDASRPAGIKCGRQVTDTGHFNAAAPTNWASRVCTRTAASKCWPSISAHGSMRLKVNIRTLGRIRRRILDCDGRAGRMRLGGFAVGITPARRSAPLSWSRNTRTSISPTAPRRRRCSTSGTSA